MKNKWTKNLCLMSSFLITWVLLCSTCYGTLEIDIKGKDRTSPWRGHVSDSTWDHIVPFSHCRDQFKKKCKKQSLTSDEKNFLITFRDAFNKDPLKCIYIKWYNKKASLDKCADIRSKLVAQINTPQKNHGTITLDWDNYTDSPILGLLLYRQFNGANNRGGGKDPKDSLDVRPIPVAHRENVTKSFQKWYGVGASSAIGNNGWCKAYNTLIKSKYVNPWDLTN
jgi:hypothetical protein